MNLVKPSIEILNENHIHGMISRIECAGRTCYKSDSEYTYETAVAFLEKIMKRGHLSVIEHESISVRFIIDRGVSHELVRHRLCAFSQESTRYCNYSGGVTFVIPPWVDVKPGEYDIMIAESFDSDKNSAIWLSLMLNAEDEYISLLRCGWTPQQARSVLPNSLKTEIVVTANLREWRHILSLRTSKAAHPQMQEVMIPLFAEMKRLIPVIFDDIG